MPRGIPKQADTTWLTTHLRAKDTETVVDVNGNALPHVAHKDDISTLGGQSQSNNYPQYQEIHILNTDGGVTLKKQHVLAKELINLGLTI